ncbi:GDP-mannose 6-dehydrogenase [Bradyrhizobium sp. SSBR45G]|uniref:nucleotide sugar dehydrogenase n=1 Tax=unclassified Bradyrhizobium TaxID=2631580 RepID=UPI002342B02D|nr:MULTISPECIES: nucleotide sugar dehydrogenase [unclassified Bradyrhizobium]GLH76755.1 GDP-mannose 6-dehydrogenase [Bradyrhizobium sp. SSBR45G]GLH83513.1 GDP-mannose 6-dehydrogenase [Bradyrhizobium sp. SSBR45R]
MNISIFGLGYVGTVCAACLAELGHTIIGVDKAGAKVELIRTGQSPVIEPGISEKVAKAVANGRLTASADATMAIAASDISMICVGTPSAASGDLDLTAIRQVAAEIGRGLKDKPTPHLIVIRSTVLPGTSQKIVVPLLEEASGKKAGTDFEVSFNPEFLREGCAIADFNTPSKTVVGADRKETAERVLALYDELPGAKIATSIETAELAKYIDNSWHALKVAFANEVGVIAKTLDIDSRDVIDIFLQDTRLNISAAYLRPGFAFGGSCLPKDVKALKHLAQSHGLSVPVIENVLPSNDMVMSRGVDWILSQAGRKVAFLGISFKAGTDDVRESPFVLLVNRLLSQDREVRVYDPNVRLSQLIGANRDFLMRNRQIAEILVDDVAEAIGWADIIVLTTNDPRFIQALSGTRSGQTILELTEARLPEDVRATVKGFHW